MALIVLVQWLNKYMNPPVLACYHATWCLNDVLYQLPAPVSPSGTSTIPVLLPFESGAALPGLSAEASPNEVSVSGRMLGGELPGGNYQSRGLAGLSLYT